MSRIATILIRLGIDSPHAEKLLRRGFIHAALHLHANKKPPTQSGLASLAGLSRLEVRTILNGTWSRRTTHSTRIDRVIAGWTRDPKFLDRRGRPRALEIRGTGWTFDRLVKKYGRDVTARTLLVELTRRRIAVVRESRLALVAKAIKPSKEAAAALADLKFLEAHLGGIEFHLGRRSYILRNGSLAAGDPKSAEMLKKLAVSRLETVLNSLADISVDTSKAMHRKKRRARRLLISAIVATEAEDEDV
ncbi:MAG TPA: DUF6502 family protein [Steroidobacteraceae bacterium]|nr:DUF6502 family protein [Steroidobacteraceae bacterium]